MNRALKNFDVQLLEPEDTAIKGAKEVNDELAEDEELEAERMTERIWRKVLDTLGKNRSAGS
jgi:hypothetical protein